MAIFINNKQAPVTIRADFNKDGVKDVATFTGAKWDENNKVVDATIEDANLVKLRVTISANPQKRTPAKTSEVVVAGDSALGADVFVEEKMGSLRVNTKLVGTSMDNETRTATFAYRDGQMVVAGVTSARTFWGDGTEKVEAYDYNALTGKGTVSFPVEVTPMEDYQAGKAVLVRSTDTSE
jgi:hypothetical protein